MYQNFEKFSLLKETETVTSSNTIPTTMEAEKQWMAEELKEILPPNPVIVSADQTVEAYKSQLKKLIEERIADYGDRFRKGSQESGYIESGELKWVLELLDKVKPPESRPSQGRDTKGKSRGNGKAR